MNKNIFNLNELSTLNVEDKNMSIINKLIGSQDDNDQWMK